MCEPDYISSCIITGAEGSMLIDGSIMKAVDVKCRIGDQTIIDNSQVPKMKIGTLKAPMAVV